MAQKTLQAERDLKQLSQSLGLEYEQQDWGILNADGRRLSEFIAYYQANPGLSATQKYELGGLILASANELLLRAGSSLPEEFGAFLTDNRPAFEASVEYWQSLQDPVEFPLGKWLGAH
jgi:hypothetical protein